MSEVRTLLREHFGVDEDLLDDVPAVTIRVPQWRRLALQSAVDALSADLDAATYGVEGEYLSPSWVGLLTMPELAFAPVAHEQLPIGPERSRGCLTAGLVVGRSRELPVVLWVRPAKESLVDSSQDVAVTAAGPSMESVQAVLGELSAVMASTNPYAGASIRLRLNRASQVAGIDFLPRPRLAREELILSEDVLSALDGHAIGIGRHAERLRAAGRHLKRGLLLHGPPGTGKTHTVRYLSSQLPDAVLIVLTGELLAHVGAVTDLLNEIAPAIVVLDDVDLIAEHRDNAAGSRAPLFDLLDAMDGLRDDLDVLFVLTTNRPAELETAITMRPGRIDQSLEISLPDAACRRRLIDLYRRGLEWRVADVDAVVARTDGVAASFLKEMLRRSWILAHAGGASAVTDVTVMAALDELLDPEQPLTDLLLGRHPQTVTATA